MDLPRRRRANRRHRAPQVDDEDRHRRQVGEFRVNDTTAGDQILPDVAMDAAGDFVITWTSYGQDGDAASQSNVYAKRYASTSLGLERRQHRPRGLRGQQHAGGHVEPYVTTVDNPDNHIVRPGTGYDGVVRSVRQRLRAASSRLRLAAGRHRTGF